jgi:predicted nucleic acid-binding protein
MSVIFAETAGWGHLFDAQQTYHHQAATIYRQARLEDTQILTTNLVINELVTLLTSPLHVPRPTLVALVEGIKASPFVEIIHVDETVEDRAWHLLKSRLDKTWSVVDCASFVIMHERGIQNAFTSDHHFEQAGFIRLLK